jgi:hypothetical protein
MNISQIKEAIQYFETKPDVYLLANKIANDNIRILFKISKNEALFHRVRRLCPNVFTQSIEAIHHMKKEPNNVLIHFSDIDLYGVFKYTEYIHFANNLREDIYQDNVAVHLYQLVLSGTKQKLVFVCSDAQYFSKLQTYAKDCFKTNTFRSNDQITIDIVTSNETEIFDSYVRLYNYVKTKDPLAAESMKQILPDLDNYDCSYRYYSCNDTLNASNVDELIKLLRTLPNNESITVNIYNNNVINNVGGNNNHINVTPNYIKDTENWINNNPPHLESTGNYFKHYKSCINRPIGIQEFAQTMVRLGFRKSRYNTQNIWTR